MLILFSYNMNVESANQRWLVMCQMKGEIDDFVIGMKMFGIKNLMWGK